MNNTTVMDAGAGGFSFPTLKANRIIECLQDLQISVTEECLLNPEKNVGSIQRVFERLVEATTCVTREQLAQPVFAGLNVLNFAELHDDSIPELAFFRACTRMMETACVFDFSLKDLLQPTKQRLRRHLSAVINFCKFREERMMVYTGLLGRKEEEMARRAANAEENRRLLEELAAEEQRTAEEVQAIEETSAACRSEESQINEKNREQAEIRHESTLLKKSANEARERLAELSTNIEDRRAEREKLTGQIVNSPARIRREMGDQQQALEQERLDGAHAEKEAIRLEACVAEVAHAESEMQKTLRAVEEVDSELAKQRDALREVRGAQSSVEANRGRAVDLRAELQGLSRQLLRFDEKLQHVRRQAALKAQHASEHADGLQAELAESERAQREAATRVAAVEAEVARLEALAQSEARRAEEERREMISAYRRMEGAVLEHQQALVRTLRA